MVKGRSPEGDEFGGEERAIILLAALVRAARATVEIPTGIGLAMSTAPSAISKARVER